MIHNVIEILRQGDFYGAGQATEIAKGKNELVYTFKDLKRKVKRIWLSKRK